MLNTGCIKPCLRPFQGHLTLSCCFLFIISIDQLWDSLCHGPEWCFSFEDRNHQEFGSLSPGWWVWFHRWQAGLTQITDSEMNAWYSKWIHQKCMRLHHSLTLASSVSDIWIGLIWITFTPGITACRFSSLLDISSLLKRTLVNLLNSSETETSKYWKII